LKDINACLAHVPALFLYKNEEFYTSQLHYLALLLLSIPLAF